ncbi:MAG TPA: alpha/beta hydrolase [Candidatus Binataceae bacterium]|jgi:esterase|nr:alpha/beta hydrolase [Candidatus Binataceae bacterium]
MIKPLSRVMPGSPKLHYLEWNPAGAKTLVLLHGVTANAWWWEDCARYLPTCLRLLAMDQRGHGDSEWVRPPAYSPADYAQDVARFVDFCGAKDAVIVGHSQGGINALAFIRDRPHAARAVVAIDIALTSTSRRDRFLVRLKNLPTVAYPDLEIAKARFRLMPREGDIPAEVLARVAERSLGRVAGGGYTFKFDRDSFYGSDGIDVLETIRLVRVPLLLVRGGRSRIMTAQAAQHALQLNPLVRLAVIEDSHHHVIFERPAALAALVEEFVRELDAAAP